MLMDNQVKVAREEAEAVEYSSTLWFLDYVMVPAVLPIFRYARIYYNY